MPDNEQDEDGSHSASSAVKSALDPQSTCEQSDKNALEDLMPVVYEELRRLAAGYLRGERQEHTLQPTALVHEAFLRLAKQGQVRWQNRAHVLGIAARLMRQTLINYAAAKTRLKRGGPGTVRITLDEALHFYEQRDVSLPAIDQALRRLEELDSRQAQIVEMRFFGGLTVEEVSKALDVSVATVKRDWTLAKIWLRRELSA